MTDYRRPAFPAETHRDEQGHPIDYGRRWGGSPPEDAYTRLSNLQRFAPLHTVALALIDWLQSTFDVTVEHTPGVAADLLLLPTDVVRAVRVTPRDPAAAALTLVLSGFPGVFLHAGLLHDFHFPACGCDACDDDVTNLVDELEWTVRAVVSGHYSERIVPSRATASRTGSMGQGSGRNPDTDVTRSYPRSGWRMRARRFRKPDSGRPGHRRGEARAECRRHVVRWTYVPPH